MKLINKKNYNVYLANLSDKKTMFDFAKEMYFDEEIVGNKNSRDKSLMRLLKLPAIMAGSLKNSKPKSCSERVFCLLILMNCVTG